MKCSKANIFLTAILATTAIAAVNRPSSIQLTYQYSDSNTEYTFRLRSYHHLLRRKWLNAG